MQEIFSSRRFLDQLPQARRIAELLELLALGAVPRRIPKPSDVMYVHVSNNNATDRQILEAIKLDLQTENRLDLSWRRWAIPGTEQQRPVTTVDDMP